MIFAITYNFGERKSGLQVYVVVLPHFSYSLIVVACCRCFQVVVMVVLDPGDLSRTNMLFLRSLSLYIIRNFYVC